MRLNKKEVTVERIINFLKRQYTGQKNRRRSSLYIDSLSRNRVEGNIIKVAFLVQMPEVWDKEEPVYEEMKRDDSFAPYLIIIPQYDFASDRFGGYGTELSYFLDKGDNSNTIIAYKDGNWVDIMDYGFDYVFYQRPYQHYLPEEYRSDNLVSKVKICYVPYATTDAKGESSCFPQDFLRNIYYGFMDSEESARINNRKYHHKEHVSFYFTGYPAYEKRLLNDFDECKYSTVLWTPRWTYDRKEGGSHFFEYNEFFSGFDCRKHNLMVRPHPLMWDNFEKEGRMTKNEKEKILARWDGNGIIVDTNSSIEETFKKTDILVSDRSSIIPIFFFTGKPIIYCACHLKPNEEFESILQGIYSVRNEKELSKTLRELLEGYDPLKKKRMQIVENKKKLHSAATNNILNLIKKDAKGE